MTLLELWSNSDAFNHFAEDLLIQEFWTTWT